MNDLRVGFVGLGDMGGAQAQRIIDAGFLTTLWARREASLAPFQNASNVSVAGSLKELGIACDVVGVCVFDDEGVMQVVDGDGEGVLHGMAPGGVIAIHSTISPQTCEMLETMGSEKGVQILDAPVSGARQGAVGGTLCVMVGGAANGFEKALPFFQCFGSTIELMGPIGSGQRAKLLNNVLNFCNGTLACIAFEVGEKLGLDVHRTQNVLSASSSCSPAMQSLLHRLIPDAQFCAHALTMIRKDTKQFHRVCEEHGIPRGTLNELADLRITLTENMLEID